MALTKVQTTGLADDAVTSAKIADDAVVAAAVADDAVGIAQLSATGTAGNTTFLRGDNSWQVVDTSIADDSVAEVKLDISNAPSDGKFLQYKDNSDKLTWAAASSAEIYGFTKNGNNLNVTTTNGGADNISGATYAAFNEAFFAATGFSWSINASGNLIATI